MATELSMIIVLIDSDRSRLAHLRQELSDLSIIETKEVERAAYTLPPRGLDAVFLTLPAAERWSPDFKSRSMQIVKTSDKDQAVGYPPLVVTGVNLTEEDPKDPLSQVRLIIELTLAKVRDYNERERGKVNRIGFWMLDLARGITTTELIGLLRRIVTDL
jgi:hypothetical protein